MKKKKILAIALVVAVLAIVSIASLAWFTDTDEVTNVFTFGEVSITMHDEGKDGKPFNGEDGLTKQPLLPGVPVDKIVYATNDGDPELPGNEAYVRAFIGVPEKLDDVLDLTFDTENWTKDSDSYIAEIEGIRYKVYQFTYSTALGAGDNTTKVLTKVELDNKVDIKNGKLCIPNEKDEGYTYFDFDINALREMKIPVAMQAVQTAGFENADAAFEDAFNGCPWPEAESENPAEFNFIIKAGDLNKDISAIWNAPEESGFEKLEFTIPAGTFKESVKPVFTPSSNGNKCELSVQFIKIDEDGEPVLDEDGNQILITPDTSKLIVDVYSPFPHVGDGGVTASVEIELDDDAGWYDFMNILNCIKWHQTTTD